MSIFFDSVSRLPKFFGMNLHLHHLPLSRIEEPAGRTLRTLLAFPDAAVKLYPQMMGIHADFSCHSALLFQIFEIRGLRILRSWFWTVEYLEYLEFGMFQVWMVLNWIRVVVYHSSRMKARWQDIENCENRSDAGAKWRLSLGARLATHGVVLMISNECVYICMLYICMYVYVCICMYMYVYVCICIYIYYYNCFRFFVYIIYIYMYICTPNEQGFEWGRRNRWYL